MQEGRGKSFRVYTPLLKKKMFTKVLLMVKSVPQRRDLCQYAQTNYYLTC